MHLSDVVAVDQRFARSANVERDRGPDAISGYIPTARALDLLWRIVRGLKDPVAGRAFSITGPHGGGKSSFAVFLRALFSDRSSRDYVAAMDVLTEADPDLAGAWAESLRQVDPGGSGALAGFVTATQESVTASLARAIGPLLSPGSTLEAAGPADPAGVLLGVRELAARGLVVLVVDEFGKNLQYFSSVGGDGDPYLLQEVAEIASGPSALPVVLITMQHLSFDEYVTDADSTRRREWAKVQGRFHDVPYVETARQARALIGSTIHHRARANQIERWARHQEKIAERLGLPDLVDSIRPSYPLHPVALAVLPDLCSRYGQNERTLFSFLAGSEPHALPEVMRTTKWRTEPNLPALGLERIYEYFVESASTTIGTATTASRWLEIETRIRDAIGLSPDEASMLKSVGVLNLVSSGGAVRASRAVLRWATQDWADDQFDSAVKSLESRGLITYREFADEYRVWAGSDFDLRGAVEVARREARDQPLADLLNQLLDLEPVVAGRHSQRVGVLRVFEQRYADQVPSVASLTDEEDGTLDGHVVFITSPVPRFEPAGVSSRPVVLVHAEGLRAVQEAAIETAALAGAVRSVEASRADWVAQRELQERLATSKQLLVERVNDAWHDAGSRWILANTAEELDPVQGRSALLSEACDRIYGATPPVANEMIARRELTSQGAKARRLLIDAMLRAPHLESFGIVGYPPERAMYEALFRATGMHRRARDGRWRLGRPTDRKWARAWTALEEELTSATFERRPLLDVYRVLTLPPFGLKSGVLPVLLLAVLSVQSRDVALYEHGSLVPALDDAVAERLAKNPQHFSVKNFATDAGPRSEVIQALAQSLGIRSAEGVPSFLQLAQALYRELQKLPPYTRQTKSGISDRAAQFLQAFQAATEPDVLIFCRLPQLLGFDEIGPEAFLSAERSQLFANEVAEVVRELNRAYPSLLSSLEGSIANATGVAGSLSRLRHHLGARAGSIDGRVLEPRLRAFFRGLDRTGLDDQEWLENVAMIVAGGRAPRVWTDEERIRFELQVRELGGAMQRTLALLFDRPGAGAGFAARRLTVTESDGTETSEVLAMDHDDWSATAAVIGDAWKVLLDQAGSEELARRRLLAWLILPEGATSDDVGASTEPNRRVESA